MHVLTLQIALLAFVHLCARVVSAFGYVIGLTPVRTGGWLVGSVANAGLYVLLLEKATFHTAAAAK